MTEIACMAATGSRLVSVGYRYQCAYTPYSTPVAIRYRSRYRYQVCGGAVVVIKFQMALTGWARLQEGECYAVGVCYRYGSLH